MQIYTGQMYFIARSVQRSRIAYLSERHTFFLSKPIPCIAIISSHDFIDQRSGKRCQRKRKRKEKKWKTRRIEIELIVSQIASRCLVRRAAVIRFSSSNVVKRDYPHRGYT